MQHRNSLLFRPFCFFVFACIFNSPGVQGQVAEKQGTQGILPGMYKNPIIYADYSDPDVIRVDENYYLTASSFNCVPGLPVLKSIDLVNWEPVTYALQRLLPENIFSRPQHGNGVWAPAMRYHEGNFYIYYGDPDYGIFMLKASKAEGPWSEPLLVEAGRGLIDPCPFYDDNGKIYLVHAFAGSRAGIKSILVIRELDTDGEKVVGHPVLVFDGHTENPTVEGPKLYKRGKYYYIFAPAGGVKTGWQLVLRSENIYGPYESRKVLHQGSTEVNGPHQGAWVETPSGDSWFIHFQDMDAYGRVVHLQPVNWVNNWPVIGLDTDQDGIGEPVRTHTSPLPGTFQSAFSMPVSDEFNGLRPGWQWQWHANPQSHWGFSSGEVGFFRLNAILFPGISENLWEVPNLFLQKLPAGEFTVQAKINVALRQAGERAGLLLMGTGYAYIGVQRANDGMQLIYGECYDAENGNTEKITILSPLSVTVLYFELSMMSNAQYKLGYSLDGKNFVSLPEIFTARPGKWIGAKMGFFCLSVAESNDSGFMDIDWFRLIP